MRIRWGVLALMLVVSPGALRAQEPSGGVCATVFGGDPAQGRQMVGLQICYNCHASGSTAGPDDLAAQLGIAVGGGWIKGNELRIWGGEDRHSQAYATLLGETAARIGRALGREGTIHRDVRCIACHSAYPLSQLSAENLLIGEVVQTDLKLTQGVSCEGCHGAAGSGTAGGAVAALEGWLNPHVNSDKWRFLSAADKCRSGYSDIRSVVSRTRMCASCHVGDASMGRVLTHEMYAAGHPPLPPFELETFEDLMPKHWLDFREKNEGLREQFQQRAAVKMTDAEASRSRTTVISALVVYAAFLRLTADLADPAGGDSLQGLPRPAWPEFSQFDCYACHHDLKSRNWRQTVQATGRPGRPRLVPWPAALARAASSLNAGDFGGLEQRLNESVVATPFGDGPAVTKAARELATACDALALSIESSDWTQDSQRQMLQAVLSAGGGLVTPVADYDSARQYAWAFGVLQGELSGTERSKVIEEWFGSESGLSTRSGVPLLLDLKVGEDVKLMIPGAQKERSILQIDPQRVLPPIAGYDAIQFQAAFREIQQKLTGSAAPK
ncbi:MAG: multiheme c-type cytochrome [Planctomycetota bacterium]